MDVGALEKGGNASLWVELGCEKAARGCSALAEWAERPKAIKTRVVMRGDRAMLRGAAP